MTSFLDELKADHAEALTNSTKVIGVPVSGQPPSNWHHGVRFRPPSDPSRLNDVMAAARSLGAPTSEQALQLIVDCCDEVVRNAGNAEKPTWESIEGDKPLRFDASDERWGDDVKNARDCVRKLYKLDVQPAVHFNVADVLIDWLQGIDLQAMARVEGKSDNGAASSATPPASKPTASTDSGS